MLIDEIALRQIVREEMKSALKEVGLQDDAAANDVRELRSLVSDWRIIKKTIFQTVARWGTLIVLGLLTIGTWNKFNGGSGE